MADHTYHFDITMTCGGCSGAIDRVLKRIDGIRSYEVSLEHQTADVVAAPELEFATVLEKIKKTGKTVKGATKDGQAVEI